MEHSSNCLGYIPICTWVGTIVLKLIEWKGRWPNMIIKLGNSLMIVVDLFIYFQLSYYLTVQMFNELREVYCTIQFEGFQIVVKILKLEFGLLKTFLHS